MTRSILVGALGFALVSLIAFSVWAFGGAWFRFPGGELTMYALIAVLFLGLTGVVLSRLVRGERPMARFYGAFLPAFFAYAIVWCLAWFLIKGRASEWIGSFAGSVVFATIVHARFKSMRGFVFTAVIVFIAHSLGYFLGGEWMYGTLRNGLAGLAKPQVALAAKLGWGLFYGLGFGAGIGAAFHRAQALVRSDLDATSGS